MRYIILICVGLVLTSTSFAQKVKYKDLYVLLRVENYEDADKFLRIYLEQEPEDPHANYSMGRMLQAYLDKGDLLNGSERLKELADSAKYYYQRAYDLTTEKFVRKNDDKYYLDFRRRDMRTGKFEVKFSDVQYDIEQRIETVEKFGRDLDRLLNHFKEAQEFYRQCQMIYDSITEQAPSENLLYFTSTTDDVDILRGLAQQYDSSMFHLDTYRLLMKGMGDGAVNQQLEEGNIENYPTGGLAEIDFYQEIIQYLNYKAWANKTIDIILKEIFPLKKRLITFDKRVKDLHDEVVEDSLDKRDLVFQLATENVGRDLRDYDPNSLPAAIFNYRIAEINYHSAVYYWLQQIADTLDTGLKLETIYDFKSQIAGVSKLVHKMEEANNPKQIRLYREYVDARYDSPEGLNQFIVEHAKEVRDDSLQLAEWVEEVKELDKIAFWRQDSIALTSGVVLGAPGNSFTTILIDTLATRTIGFYAWQRTADSLSLSFGVAPSSRQVDSLFQVPLNGSVYDPILPIPEYFVDTVGLGQRVWLLQSKEMQEDSTYAIQVILTDYTMGPSWSRQLTVKNHVSQLKKETNSNNLLIMGEGDELLVVLDHYGQAVVDEAEEVTAEDPEDKGEGPEDKGQEQPEQEGGGGS